MNNIDIRNYYLLLVSHFYWERKVHFKLSQDTYPSWVLFLVESGSFNYEIGKEAGIIQEGEMVFCPPNFTFKREALSPLALHFIGFDLKGNGLEKTPIPMSTFKAKPLDEKRLASNFSYLRRLNLSMEKKDIQQKQWILNDIWQLACNDWDTQTNQDILADIGVSDDDLMNWALEWLLQNFHKRFSIRDLSSKIGLSPVQFSRRFQKAFHKTPSDFVKMLRIRKAARLLLDTDYTLDQIAERCGYDNGFYLSRVFSSYMQMSPSRYRELNRI
ncbi:helix-turn-helix domain-containing protein [Gracilibacillus dipsosauri]|uniref:helix-turn-helix domain-containing protein n=1 Tax=Gracilibacillus dipsosauri TaxID=178340 RepID=UPI0024093910